MRSTLCCVLFAGLCAFGQSATAVQAGAKLDSILGAMKDPGASQSALSQQLADVIFSLAERDRLPSRNTVRGFTDELTGALIGRPLDGTAGQEWLLGPIMEILSSSGANFTKASRLGNILKSLGVDPTRTQRITSKFIKIGEEVRGPDDLHVMPVVGIKPLK